MAFWRCLLVSLIAGFANWTLPADGIAPITVVVAASTRDAKVCIPRSLGDKLTQGGARRDRARFPGENRHSWGEWHHRSGRIVILDTPLVRGG